MMTLFSRPFPKKSFIFLETWVGCLATLLILWKTTRLFQHALQYGPVIDDAGTYLSFVRAINSGTKLYLELMCGYTPLSTYSLSLCQLFFFPTEASFFHFSSCICCLQIINSILLYAILRKNHCPKVVACFFSSFNLLMLYRFQGYQILLEPFVIFFVLITILLFCHLHERLWAWFILGILVCLAFLSKQYGLCLLPALGLMASQAQQTVPRTNRFKTQQLLLLFVWLGLLFFTAKIAILSLPFFLFLWLSLCCSFDLELFLKRNLILLLGFGCGFMTFLLLQYHLLDIGPLVFLKHIFQFSYTERSPTFSSSGLQNLLLHHFPVLFLSPLFLKIYVQDKNLMFAYLTCSLFIIPLTIRGFDHYYMLILPLLSMITAILYRNLRESCFPIALLVIISLLPGLWTTHLTAIDWKQQPTKKIAQQQLRQELRPLLERKKTLALINPAYLFLLALESPDPKGITYGFLDNYPRDALLKALHLSEFVLYDESDAYYGRKMAKRILPDFKEELLNLGFELVKTIGTNIFVYQKPSPKPSS